MIDFLLISQRCPKRGTIEVYPKFIIKKSNDLMIRGGDFYAIWMEDVGLWSTDEGDALRLIDEALDKYANDIRDKHQDDYVKVLHMWDAESGMIDRWHKYCQKQMRDSFHMLDEKIIFSNTDLKKRDYASKKLSYPLEATSTPAYDELMSTLYSPEERHKLEWAIGSIVNGDSKKIQKFMVLYGAAGTGKSTVLNIIQQLFDGYYSVFDAKSLGSSSNSFALEAFKTNPLVAIQHDGDLSHIEDNTRLNSLVSHEMMTVNEKFKSTYANQFKSFLFMGTNKPVKITDSRSGLLRRLIDVTPTGQKLPVSDYKRLVKQIPFELGGIAQHCLDIYNEAPDFYEDYIPLSMMGASNDFYNFMVDHYHIFAAENGVGLKQAWELYKNWCEDTKVPYPFSQRVFKEELRSYFDIYEDRHQFEDGTRARSYYSGFRTDRFVNPTEGKEKKKAKKQPTIIFEEGPSNFDSICSSCLAQYASEQETPSKRWANVKTVLRELDTHELHYVKVPENHIVIDFDIPDESGNKSFKKNLEEASKWPPTYAELSKSGAGIHLHYIYTGDPSKLSRVFAEHIEVKVYSGNSALRRKLTKCNNLPIATISSGLPLKGEKMVNFDTVKSEKGLRTLVEKNLKKEIHPGTKPSIDFIFKILEDAYTGGMHYDLTDMQPAVISFAAQSSNHSDYCLKVVAKMHFKSDDISPDVVREEAPLVFFDVEVFPNLFLVNWKFQGKGRSVQRMINPKPAEIEELLKYRLVGFNNRRYDNHMLYARLMGYSEEQLFKLSQRIINAQKGDSGKALFGEAYNLSYTDIYDFAATKQSLKKWEIELGIHHQELGLPWDQPVPESRWIEVAEYCDNDVLATEAVFDHLTADFTARQILADLANGTVNETTNTLTGRIIFGNERKPQSQFRYRNLAEPVRTIDPETKKFLVDIFPEMMSKPHGKAGSILPYFEGYKFENGISTYKDTEVGEGGFVYAEPSIYFWVALLDIASMHPHSALAECLFGPKFTRAFYDIVYGRVNIKHEAWDIVDKMLDGKLKPYVEMVKAGKMSSKDLAYALKIAINSVYGLTAAKFDNLFKDPRNIDNIVAKRGALFMVDLKEFVQSKGFTVAHIKTDSIKVPGATPELISEIMAFGKRYGYTFEHEATYERMCLVNDAVYIAKYADPDACKTLYGYSPEENTKHGNQWTATGKQFAVPYVFKTLFSKEPLEFRDKCETFSCSTSLYLDMNEGLPNVENLEKELSKLESKYKKGELSDTTFEKESAPLAEEIAKGHDYIFIGKVGLFCPIKPGMGGGVLYREKDGKYYAAAGTTGYRWLETEMVQTLGRESAIDESYYISLVDAAVDTIRQYGDFEEFVQEGAIPLPNPKLPDNFMNLPEGYGQPGSPEELPWN